MHPVLWGVGQLFGIGRSAQLFITGAVMSSCDDIMMWVQPQLQWVQTQQPRAVARPQCHRRLHSATAAKILCDATEEAERPRPALGEATAP